MANKCYASTILLLRIWRAGGADRRARPPQLNTAIFSSAKAVGWSISCAISHVREMTMIMTMIVCGRAEKRTRSSPQTNWIHYRGQ